MGAESGNLRRITVLALVMALCLPMAASVANAQDQRTGGSVTIGPDETHDGDLETTAGTVQVDGTIDGDLEATGGSVTITGDVNGDLTVTAGTVIIEGDVEGDLTATGGDVHIREGATIGGPAEVTGGTITVDGMINSDTRLDGDTITIGPTTTIDGDLTYSADEFERSDDAEIAGSVTERESFGEGPFSDVSLPDIPDALVTPLAGVYLFLANLMLGATVLLLAPRFSDQVSEQGLDRPIVSGGIGVVTLFGMPVLLIGLFLSIIGIPLAFFAGYSFIFVAWLGLLYGALVIGRWSLSLVDRVHRWGALSLGLAIVSVVNALPYVGFLLIVIMLIGLGAFVQVLYNWRFGGGDGNGGQGSQDTPGVVSEPAA